MVQFVSFFDLCEYQQHTEKDFSNYSIGIEFINDPWVTTKKSSTIKYYKDTEEIVIQNMRRAWQQVIIAITDSIRASCNSFGVAKKRI